MMKRLVISLLAGVLTVLVIVLFTPSSISTIIPYIEPQLFLMNRNGSVQSAAVFISPNTENGELSFFADVYLEPKNSGKGGKRVSSLLLRGGSGGGSGRAATDKKPSFAFWVRPSGDLGIQWGKRRLLAATADKTFNAPKMNPGFWHKVGFIYDKTPGTQTGTLTAYINGKPAWEANVNPVPGSLSSVLSRGGVMEWLPEIKNPAGRIPCVSEAASPLLVKKVLTAHQLLDLHRDFRYYHSFFFHVVILFILLSATVFLLWNNIHWNHGSGGWKIKWLFIVHYWLFLVFGFGASAAGYIHEYAADRPLLNLSSYFSLLMVSGIFILAVCAFSRFMPGSLKKNLFYFGGVLALFFFTVFLSLLPRSPLTVPFIFNTLYWLVFSLFSAAPFILEPGPVNPPSPGEADDEK